MLASLQVSISIHAPHTGRDAVRYAAHLDNPEFQSTRPIRGATLLLFCSCYSFDYFNPRAPYGARRMRGGISRPAIFISIHAPHTGRDHPQRGAQTQRPDFNPRAPYGARPPFGCSAAADACHFNPRAPYGARRMSANEIAAKVQISIHAPHTGRDSPSNQPYGRPPHFNPRAPYGARPLIVVFFCPPNYFNPRAPYGARRAARAGREPGGRDFNPRAPYGARPLIVVFFCPPNYFNPRAPYGARRAARAGREPGGRDFNPRAPYGARPQNRATFAATFISIHAPHTGRDHGQHGAHTKQDISIHAPHTGRDCPIASRRVSTV